MIVRSLMAALDHAQTPRGVRMATWALEKATGIRTVDLLERKDSSFGFDTVTGSDWLQRNGYYRLSGLAGGASSYSGVSVTPDVSLESSAIYGCVKIISEDMGSLPFFTYRRAVDRTIEKAYDHPLYRALHDLPNPEIAAGEFVEMLTAHAALGCDGFAEIQRVSEQIFLWPWMPQEVRIERNSRGALFYIRKEGNAQEKTFARDRVFHLRGFTLDGVRGDEILRRARHSIGIGLAAQEYAGRFFSQDASPGIILERPAGAPSLGPESVDAVKKAWKAWHQGLSRSHEPAILQDGTVAKRLDPDHQKLQLLEIRKFQVVEACRLWRMPPHKLADHERLTFSNVEELNRDYAWHTLGPWVRRWQQTVYRCLLTVDEQLADSVYAEHNVAALLEGRFDAQSEGFRKLLEKGVFSINEVRRLMNHNPIPSGDAHFIQLNMGTVQDVASGATLPDATTPNPNLVPVGGKP